MFEKGKIGKFIKGEYNKKLYPYGYQKLKVKKKKTNKKKRFFLMQAQINQCGFRFYVRVCVHLGLRFSSIYSGQIPSVAILYL